MPSGELDAGASGVSGRAIEIEVGSPLPAEPARRETGTVEVVYGDASRSAARGREVGCETRAATVAMPSAATGAAAGTRSQARASAARGGRAGSDSGADFSADAGAGLDDDFDEDFDDDEFSLSDIEPMGTTQRVVLVFVALLIALGAGLLIWYWFG